MVEVPTRKVSLLAERRDDGSSLYLGASIEDDGRLVISGQDLGPITEPISSDGEYEYAYTVAAEDVPAMTLALGGVSEDEDVLAILERDWSGARSYGLGAAVQENGVSYEFWNWS